MKDLDAMLSEADPAGEPTNTRQLVKALAESVATEGTKKSTGGRVGWGARRLAIPVAVGGMLALTAAAVVIPLSLSVNGHEVEVDATIPITYTTDTGVTIVCEYGIYVGDPTARTAADEAMVAFLESEDWTGIGQEIYEEAINNPFVPTPEDNWEDDTQEVRDNTSFMHAAHLIEARIPAHLRLDGMISAGMTTCTGQLR